VAKKNGSRAADRRRRKIIEHVKAQRGLDREQFFDEGGELCRWRGMKTVEVDRKKKANKNACRKFNRRNVQG
jgi:hypothetical protein|tara:strand:+ start:490 stop:705 length:216 start_codon:yes stop_codon:yes gene_type:complete